MGRFGSPQSPNKAVRRRTQAALFHARSRRLDADTTPIIIVPTYRADTTLVTADRTTITADYSR